MKTQERRRKNLHFCLLLFCVVRCCRAKDDDFKRDDDFDERDFDDEKEEEKDKKIWRRCLFVAKAEYEYETNENEEWWERRDEY